jgi:hypothetical protein
LIPSGIPHLEEILNQKNLRKVVTSHDLAQIGDLLTNFIYTTMRIGKKGKSGLIHVWDNSLAEAIRSSGLREYFPNKAKSPALADGGEALIAYLYFNRIFTLDELIDILDKWISESDLTDKSIEKVACASAFEQLFIHIINHCKRNNIFTDIS